MFKQRQTLPKKQSHFPVNFQIVLYTYKLDFKIKIIYKINIQVFFWLQNRTNKTYDTFGCTMRNINEKVYKPQIGMNEKL